MFNWPFFWHNGDKNSMIERKSNFGLETFMSKARILRIHEYTFIYTQRISSWMKHAYTRIVCAPAFVFVCMKRIETGRAEWRQYTWFSFPLLPMKWTARSEIPNACKHYKNFLLRLSGLSPCPYRRFNSVHVLILLVESHYERNL